MHLCSDVGLLFWLVMIISTCNDHVLPCTLKTPDISWRCRADRLQVGEVVSTIPSEPLPFPSMLEVMFYAHRTHVEGALH